MRVWSISSLSNTIPATPSNPSIPHVKRTSKLFNWVSVSIGCPENEWLAGPRISGTTSITYTGDISEKISPMIIRWKKQHGWYTHYIPMIFPKFRWHSYSIFYCPWWNLDWSMIYYHDISPWIDHSWFTISRKFPGLPCAGLEVMGPKLQRLLPGESGLGGVRMLYECYINTHFFPLNPMKIPLKTN